MNLAERVRRAEERVRPHVRRTPLVRSGRLSAAAGRDTYLKLENLQVTGSFKIRGVLNKLLALEEGELARGVITASTGNHGLATAHAAGLLGVPATIVLPETADPAKIEALRARDVRIELHGDECAAAESWARSSAESSGALYLPPYNDLDVVAGQGTIAPEIVDELGRVGALFASVGGGGMIAGIAGFLAESGIPAHAVGCLPMNSPVMYDSVKAGRIVQSRILPTLSDSTAGGVEPGAITFDLCQRLVDDWALVSEAAIGRAMALVEDEFDLTIEGAAGVAVAGLLKAAEGLSDAPGTNAVVIVCGGNIDRAAFRKAVGPRGPRDADRTHGGTEHA